MPSFTFLAALVGALIAGALSAAVIMSTPPAETTMTLTSESTRLRTGDTTTVAIAVRANTPVNVFSALLRFDHTKLQVERIDYNTSIADLWAEEPWYQNGDGTLGFAGGTTVPGGFTGEGTLITVTLRAREPGSAFLSLEDARILAHDGKGTDALTRMPLDVYLTVTEQAPAFSADTAALNTIIIRDSNRSLDLNGDGLQTLADVSIFMRHLATQNLRSDFNGDNLVGATDLSILLGE